MTSFILLILLSTAASYFLTRGLLPVLQKRAMLDIPNDRSMHKLPVPRGGGAAVLGTIFSGLDLTLFAYQQYMPYAWLMLALALLGLVSWYDDRKGAGVLLRLGTHLLAAYLTTLSLPSHQPIFGELLPLWCESAFLTIALAYFMNIYNFMDGIDGITGIESICLAAGASFLLHIIGLSMPFTDSIGALIIGASIGFLFFNWHPAKIFLGDVGSVPLGLLTGYLLVLLAINGHWAAALILPLYYLADSGLTLAKRALKREKIWQAHRQHFYQRATQAVGAHNKVAQWILLCNVLLIALALASPEYPLPASAAALFIVAILLWIMNKTAQKAPTL